MKLHITVDDIQSLNERQAQSLCAYWLPAKNDLAVAKVCKDAENDLYEYVEFVVGEIILGRGTHLTLRRLRLLEEPVEAEETPEEDEGFEFGLADDGDYYAKEDCLPLLNIGQLIALLRSSKLGQNGFSLLIPPANDRLFDQEFVLEDKFGEVNKAEELCDLLWDMFKTLL